MGLRARDAGDPQAGQTGQAQRFQTTGSPNRVILTPYDLKSAQFFLFDARKETKLIPDSSYRVL